MVPVHQFEAKKGVGGPSRHAKERVKQDLHPKKEIDLCLVGLGGHGTQGNA